MKIHRKSMHSDALNARMYENTQEKHAFVSGAAVGQIPDLNRSLRSTFYKEARMCEIHRRSMHSDALKARMYKNS